MEFHQENELMTHGLEYGKGWKWGKEDCNLTPKSFLFIAIKVFILISEFFFFFPPLLATLSGVGGDPSLHVATLGVVKLKIFKIYFLGVSNSVLKIHFIS